MANSKAIGVAFEDQAISGGTIDNTPVGATTPSTGAFTTLNASGLTTLDGNVSIGNAASDLVAFHGQTKTSQASFVATLSSVFVEGSVSASALVGFSRGQISSLLTLVNSMQAVLVGKGLMAAS